MGASKMTFLALIVCLVSYSTLTKAAITCGEVVSKLQPCIGYMRSGGAVPAACCSGIKALNAEAKTTPDRQQVCNCVKSAAASIPGLNYSNASSLGSKCGVTIPFKVGPKADCASIK